MGKGPSLSRQTVVSFSARFEGSVPTLTREVTVLHFLLPRQHPSFLSPNRQLMLVTLRVREKKKKLCNRKVAELTLLPRNQTPSLSIM
jgi:hypothetical protein